MEQRGLTAAHATALGYPVGLIRRASIRAEAILRGRQARPYLAEVARALHARGWNTTDARPPVHQPERDECFAALVLDSPMAPAAAPVWPERHGWRTSPSRQHPLGRGAACPRPATTCATSPPAQPPTPPTSGRRWKPLADLPTVQASRTPLGACAVVG